VPALETEALTLVPGVHLLGRTYPNAAYAVETGEGIVLVDTCKEEDAEPILKQLRVLRLDVSRLRLILLTHCHGDHTLGARHLKELTGARVYAGRGDADVLRTGGPPEAVFSLFRMPRAIHPTAIDGELSEGQEIRMGDSLFRVLATPGHSPGSVCILLERKGLRILFTGDTIMSLSDGAPLTGTGIYSAAISPAFRGDAAAFEDSLRRLLGLETPDLVLPGHPGSDPQPVDPRVPPWWWRHLIEKGLANLGRIRARLAEDGGDFLDGTARRILPGLHALGTSGAAASYLFRSPGGGWLLLNAPASAGAPPLLDGVAAAAGAGTVPVAVLLTSSAPDATGGLRALLEASPCPVYAPEGALDPLRDLCPPGTDLRPAAAAARLEGAGITVLPVEGAAHPSAAYAFTLEGKSIVASGEIPDPVTIEPESGEGRWSGGVAADPGAVLESMPPLERMSPRIWLPLRPLMDQNANLYDFDWARILSHTRDHLARRLR